jgi:hypothetical protein
MRRHPKGSPSNSAMRPEPHRGNVQVIGYVIKTKRTNAIASPRQLPPRSPAIAPRAADPLADTVTFRLSRTSSSPISGRRSRMPSPYLYAHRMSRPSTYPSSRNPVRRASIFCSSRQTRMQLTRPERKLGLLNHATHGRGTTWTCPCCADWPRR